MTGPVFSDPVPGYTITHQLGSGGWADVYRCVDGSGREFAVKIFRRHAEDPDAESAAFHRECDVAAALSVHPGVVKVHAAGYTASGRPWLAMSLASGTLVDLMKTSGGKVPLDKAVDLVISVAETMSWVHEGPLRMIHGDLKSANILLGDLDRPLVSDFGVAANLGTRNSVTVDQFAPTNAAPEVLTEGHASPASDVWSLAATLLELITGKPPFIQQPKEGAGAFIKRVERGLPPDAIPTWVPSAVGDQLRAALETDRDRRTPTMAAFASGLRAAQRSLGTYVTPAWPAPAAEPTTIRFIDYAEALAATRIRKPRHIREEPAGTAQRGWVRPLATAGAVAAAMAVVIGVAFGGIALIRSNVKPESAGGTQTSTATASDSATITASASPTATPPTTAPTTVGPPTATNPVTTTRPPRSSTSSPPAQPPPPSPTPTPTPTPGVITSFTISDNNGGTGLDRRLSFSLTAPSSPVTIQRYEFEYTGDSSPDATSTSTSGFITNLTNGTTYTVRVRACATQCAPWSASRTGRPYGPVPTPGASASKSGDRQIVLSWSAPGTNGRALTQLQIRIDGGGWETVAVGSGSRTVGNGPNQNHSIQVRAFDEAGQTSGTASANATTSGSWINVTPGGNAQGQPGCSSPACRYIVVELRNFASNTTYSCSFNSSLGSSGWANRNFTTNGSGNAGPTQTPYYYGVASGWVTVTCSGVVGQRQPWL